MAEFVLLRLDQMCQPQSWLRADSSGNSIGSTRVDFDHLPELPIIAVYASAELGLRAISFPKSGREKFKNALAFAVEDSVAGDVENLAFVTPANLLDGLQTVAIADKHLLQQLSETCAAISNRIRAVVPLPQLLPHDCVWVEQGKSCYRFGQYEMGCIDTESLSQLLKLKLNQDGALPLQMLLASGQSVPKLPAHISAQVLADANAYLAQRLSQSSGILNLIESKSAEEDERADIIGTLKSARWRMPVLLAAALACVYLLHWTGQYWRLSDTLADRETKVQAHFDQVFPNGPVALDPVAVLISKLKTEQQQSVILASGGALGLLRKIAPILYTETRLTLIRLDYRDAKMELSFRSPDLAGIDQLRARLATVSNLTVTLGSNNIDPNGQMLTGRIEVTESAP
jgi:type II secretion system protein L